MDTHIHTAASSLYLAMRFKNKAEKNGQKNCILLKGLYGMIRFNKKNYEK